MNKQDVIDFFDRLAPGWDADTVRHDHIIAEILDNAGVKPGADVLAQRLMDCYGGLSPLVCREAAPFAGGAVDFRRGKPPRYVISPLQGFFHC